jgi:hypothetical protein
MWDPQRLTTLWASTACYRDSFIFTDRDITPPVTLVMYVVFVCSQMYVCRAGFTGVRAPTSSKKFMTIIFALFLFLTKTKNTDYLSVILLVEKQKSH